MRSVILGASGYGGGELFRILSQHPNISDIVGTSRTLADKPIAHQHPNLAKIVNGNFKKDINWADYAGEDKVVVFASMPHGEFKQQYSSLEETWKAQGLTHKICLIDLSHDFRCDDRFIYGLSEWAPERLKGALRIANPGCFATAIQLGALPLSVHQPQSLVVTAMTGSSGSGSLPSETTHHPTRSNDFRAYKMLTHQHEEEILRTFGQMQWSPTLSFIPHSSPMVRGIFATLHCIMPQAISIQSIQEDFKTFYHDRFFIRLVQGSPKVLATVGSNFCDVGILVQGDKLLIMVALDNLGKGMASQAVQNMNLSFGFPEWTGMKNAGPYPI